MKFKSVVVHICEILSEANFTPLETATRPPSLESFECSGESGRGARSVSPSLSGADFRLNVFSIVSAEEICFQCLKCSVKDCLAHLVDQGDKETKVVD